MTRKQYVIETIAISDAAMKTLQTVRQLKLPDWAIGAGFVRNAVWDRLHGYDKPTPLSDIDVLFFDRENVDRKYEMDIEDALHALLSDRPWSVRNQARMHLRNNDHEYQNTLDAISYWLEIPTCVAVRLEPDDTLCVLAPFGLEDLMNLQVRPTRMGLRKHDQYLARIQEKNWSVKWPNLEFSYLTTP